MGVLKMALVLSPYDYHPSRLTDSSASILESIIMVTEDGSRESIEHAASRRRCDRIHAITSCERNAGLKEATRGEVIAAS